MVCFKFVQVLYELFFVHGVIFLQCGKGFQVRKQNRNFDRQYKTSEVLMRKREQRMLVVQRVQTGSTKSISRVDLSELNIFAGDSKK